MTAVYVSRQVFQQVLLVVHGFRALLPEVMVRVTDGDFRFQDLLAGQRQPFVASWSHWSPLPSKESRLMAFRRIIAQGAGHIDSGSPAYTTGVNRCSRCNLVLTKSTSRRSVIPARYVISRKRESGGFGLRASPVYVTRGCRCCRIGLTVAQARAGYPPLRESENQGIAQGMTSLLKGN